MKCKNILLKPIYLLLLGLMGASSSVCALPKMKTTFHVVDAETGFPVTNAVVRKSFRVNEQRDEQVKTTVDENGYCTISGESFSFSGGGAGALAEGYYYSGVSYAFKKRNIVLNRWEPWNPALEIKMRKKKNPVPMVARGVDREMIPEWDKSVGFDLERGDWVAPYGKGRVSDMIFFVQKTSGISGATCEISFSNKGDGIQEFVPDQSTGSEFIFPYLAPTNNYSESMCREKVYTDEYGLKFRTNAKPDAEINHLFRVRTILDAKGNVQQACYGRIKGELRVSSNGKLYFKYWFNPVPNERSLEYSGENLLKKKK